MREKSVGCVDLCVCVCVLVIRDFSYALKCVSVQGDYKYHMYTLCPDKCYHICLFNM